MNVDLLLIFLVIVTSLSTVSVLLAATAVIIAVLRRPDVTQNHIETLNTGDSFEEEEMEEASEAVEEDDDENEPWRRSLEED